MEITLSRRMDLAGNPLQLYFQIRINRRAYSGAVPLYDFRGLQHCTAEWAGIDAAIMRLQRRVFDEELGSVFAEYN